MSSLVAGGRVQLSICALAFAAVGLQDTSKVMRFNRDMWLFLCVGVTLLACVACLEEEDYCDGDVTHKKKLGEIVNLIWYAQLATPWILIFTPSDTNIKCCYDTSNGTYCSELEPEWLTRDPSCPELPHSVGQEAELSGFVSFSVIVKSTHQGYYDARIGKEERLGGCYLLITYHTNERNWAFIGMIVLLAVILSFAIVSCILYQKGYITFQKPKSSASGRQSPVELDVVVNGGPTQGSVTDDQAVREPML